MYPRRMALRRVGAESTRDVSGEGSIFEVCDGRDGGVDGESRML